ncbi:MAG: (d)CMP kinase, partial [Alphaproteobacteria bacterium]|nr:(d)CMP kinase [Alphaproteobacteria bacterium]
MIIAIDGPTAAGKGTLSQNLAQCLHFAYLDTGSLYRAVAAKLLKLDQKSEHSLMDLAPKMAETLSYNDLNIANLREESVGQLASKIAAIPDLRKALLGWQRNFAQNPPNFSNMMPAKGVILDGRDIGTVVCPEAHLKFFITASIEARAQRRYNELRAKDHNISYDKIMDDLKERDTRDSERLFAPLKAAKDAITLDTTNLDMNEVLD